MRLPKRLAVFALVGASTFLVGVSVARLGSVSTLHSQTLSAWEVLLVFENQDLGGLDEQSARILEKAIEVVTGPKNQDRVWFAPRIFRRMQNTNGESRYILVQEKPLQFIPGSAELLIHVFDTGGRILSSTQFETGNRIAITGIKVRTPLGMDHEMLVIDGRYFLGTSASHQYYALIGNQITLVYFTDAVQFYRNDPE